MKAWRSSISLVLALTGVPGVAHAQDNWPTRPMLQAGTLRAVAVASPKRAEALPELPTSAEAGFGQYQSESWFGLIAPRALPRRLVAKLNADTVSVLKEPATRERIVRQGAQPGFGPPEHFAKMQREEYAELDRLIKEIGMKVQ